MRALSVACVQLNARDDMAANIAAATSGIREAAANGAALVSTPEYVALMDGRGQVMRDGAFSEAKHPALLTFRNLAKDLRITLHIGSLTITCDDGRATNRSFLIAPDGSIVARYDKINMFDLTLPDGREIFESRSYVAGNRAVMVSAESAKLGLAICYDLRFPKLFLSLRDAGAEIILVPSSFLPTNGAAHWHVLLRARAIDCGCYIIAAAQCGEHGGKRASFGHSMIVDPWGDIVAEADDQPAVLTAMIDLDRVTETRARNPWHQNSAPFAPAGR